MSSCRFKRIPRSSSSGQLSLCEHGLRRTTSCGAVLPTGTHPGDMTKRDMILGVLSLPVAAAVSSVCMASPKPGTGDPEPAVDIGGFELRPRPSEESLEILLDVLACMSTLYGHTCQHLREVKAGYRSSDAVPENISGSICDFSTGGGSSQLARFLTAVDDVGSSAAQRPQRLVHDQIVALQRTIQQQGTVLESCYTKLLTGSTDAEVCQVMAQELRACITSTNELVNLVMNL